MVLGSRIGRINKLLVLDTCRDAPLGLPQPVGCVLANLITLQCDGHVLGCFMAPLFGSCVGRMTVDRSVN